MINTPNSSQSLLSDMDGRTPQIGSNNNNNNNNNNTNYDNNNNVSNSPFNTNRFSSFKTSPPLSDTSSAISFASLNVRGINTPSKFDSILNDLIDINLSVIGFQETKLTEQ